MGFISGITATNNAIFILYFLMEWAEMPHKVALVTSLFVTNISLITNILQFYLYVE